MTVSNMNGDALHPEVRTRDHDGAPARRRDGKPLEIEVAKLDAKGEPVLSDDGDEVMEKKSIADKDGKQSPRSSRRANR